MKILLYSEPDLKNAAQAEFGLNSEFVALRWHESDQVIVNGDINEYVFRYPTEVSLAYSIQGSLRANQEAMQRFFDREFTRYYSMLFRRNPLLTRNPYHTKALFHYHYGLVFSLLRENNFDVIVAALPSSGYDYLLVKLAESTGCRVIYITQYFKGRFLWTTALDDFAFFEGGQQLFSKASPKLSKISHKPFYVARKLSSDSERHIQDRVCLANNFLEKLIKILAVLGRVVDRIYFFTEIRLSRARVALEEQYSEATFREAQRKQPRFCGLYGLHFAPEAANLGIAPTIYDGDLGAILKVLSLLPDDGLLYVKEHPNQYLHAWARPQFFWDLLLADKRVIRVPARIDVKCLFSRIKFVALVNGTLGWESLKHGIPVLTFGSSWYSSAPGVFQGSSIQDLSDLDRVPAWAIHDLELFLSELLGTMGEGSVNHRDYNLADDEVSALWIDSSSLEGDQNEKLVLRSLGKIVKSLFSSH